MTWLTWRQHRSNAAFVGAMLLVLGVTVIYLSIAGAGLLAEARSCTPAQGACGAMQAWFNSDLQTWWGLVLQAVVVVPVLIGMFVGAPLIPRELEGGTHLLAWSQGVTRGRWFLVRAALLVVGAAVSAAVLAAIAQGWFAMERDLGGGNGFLTIWSGFDIAPPVVIAYTLFALALGIAAGAALRRTQPAMAVTLVAYIAVRVSIAVLARWRYLPPVVFRELAGGQLTAGTPAPGPGDWLLNSAPPGFFDAAGHPLNAVSVSQLIFQCTGNTQATCPKALAGVYSLTQYQPASRFWLFQGIEAAIFVVLAVALFALAYRLLMRIR
jgi:hypothetical protein